MPWKKEPSAGESQASPLRNTAGQELAEALSSAMEVPKWLERQQYEEGEQVLSVPFAGAQGETPSGLCPSYPSAAYVGVQGPFQY
jgi:hypothetical protein